MTTQKFSIGESVKFGWNTMLENVGFFIGVMVISIIVTLVHGSLKSDIGFNKNMMSMSQVGGISSGTTLPPNVNIDDLTPAQQAQFQNLNQFQAATQEEEGIGRILIRMVFNCLRILIAMGFAKIALQFVNNEPVGFATLFNSYPLFFKFLGGSILYGLMAIATFALPFIIIMLIALCVMVIPMLLTSEAQASNPGVMMMSAAYDNILSTSGLTAETISSYGFVVSLLMLPVMVGGLILIIRGSFFPYFILEYEAGPIDAIKNSFTITKDSSRKLLAFMGVLGVINIVGAMALGLGLLVTIPVTRLADAFVFKKLRDFNDNDPEMAIDLDDIDVDGYETDSENTVMDSDNSTEFDSLDSEDFDFDDDFDFDTDVENIDENGEDDELVV